MDTFIKLLLLLLAVSCTILTVTALRCRLCQRTTSLDGCDSHQECSSDEACFMDQLITHSFTTIYVGGCRAKDVCSVASSAGIVGKRAEHELLACSRCCDQKNYCNENLCNIHTSSQYVHCQDCGDHTIGRPPVSYPEDCGFTTICQPNEMCFASTEMYNGIHLQHLTQCMNNKICTALMNATFNMFDATSSLSVGRRYTDTICAVCCGDDMCNKYACETIKRRLRSLKDDGYLNVTTLKEIII